MGRRRRRGEKEGERDFIRARVGERWRKGEKGEEEGKEG